VPMAMDTNPARFVPRPQTPFMKITDLKVLNACAALFMAASAQALEPEVLYVFQAESPTDANGRNPQAGLVLGSDGNFYGTCEQGGSSDKGTVFQVTSDGMLTTVVSFTGDNGATPLGGLVLGRDHNLYGTTAYGGTTNYGTVFKVTTNGVLTTLASFSGTDGAGPGAELLVLGGGTIFRLVISAFTSVVRQPDGSVLLTGTGPANGSYRLWASTDLSLPAASWTLLTSASFDSSGSFSHMDAGAATEAARFYQLSVP
jgi:uncharacterized repeat protein (TIGR03803 family)